jgi:hypothetical protein
MIDGTVHGRADDWLFKTLGRNPGEVFLASPYLSYAVCRRLAELARDSDSRWRVSTDVNPMAVAAGYLSTHGLAELMDAGVRVSSVERLHAKAFIIGDQGFLGSANLTGAGLGTSGAPNIELGVELNPGQVQAVRRMILSWRGREVTPQDLVHVRAHAAKHLPKPKAPEPSKGPLTGWELVEPLLMDARDTRRTLWMKSEYGAPALEQWRAEWFFGSPRKGAGKKGRPTIKPGDLILVRAETGHCYAVVEVTSEPVFMPADYVALRGHEAERWPWVSRTKPRLVPNHVVNLKASDFRATTSGLQNGHIRLDIEQFAEVVRSLAVLVDER